MAANAKRRLAIRLALLLGMVALAFAMYHIGKEFNVLLDNETVTVDGTDYPMIDYAMLTIDGDDDKEIEIMADDRIIRKMVGKKHKLVLKIMAEDEETVVKTVERTITLNVDTKAWMVSLPAVANEAENIFVPNPAYSEDDEPEAVPEEEAPADDMELPMTE